MGGGGRTVFEVLRTEQDPAADAALLSALEDADLPTATAVVETLLTRNTREALYGLVQTFHLLDEPLKQLVLIEWERLFSVLREAGQSRVDQVRINMLEIIRRACIYRACYLVESALRHRSPEVREAATTTLYSLADELLRTAPGPAPDADLLITDPDQLRERMMELEEHAEDRRQLVAAIESAIGGFEIHQQPRVVEVALWFPDEMGPAFWSVLTAPGSRVAQAAIRCINPAMGPRLVPFALAALAFSEFRPHVVKMLAAGTDPAFLEEWLRQCWRLAQPKTARAMASIKELACAGHHGWELLQVPISAQRHLARWIACTGLPLSDRTALLQNLHHDGARKLRYSAVWALIAIPERPATDALWTVEDPEDPEPARIARRELARRCPLEVPISEVLDRVGADWDALAKSDRERPVMTFDRFWNLFDSMTEQQRKEARAEVLKATPLVKSVLARRLNDSECANRVRALRMIPVLGMTYAFEERLYQLCHDPAPEVRSAAVSLIAPLQTAVSRRLLHNALNDRDNRVQANAVEAVAESGHASVVDELLAKLASPDNRVQANAIKALLKLGVREAAETLLRMLGHENRMHRISALWLVERMGLFTLASRVASMASQDPDAVIRRRAADLSQHLPAGTPGATEEAGASPSRASGPAEAGTGPTKREVVV